MRTLLIGCLLLSTFCSFGASRRTQRNFTTEWNNRVIAHGGHNVSLPTIKTLQLLKEHLIQLGLTNKIWTLNMFAPDHLIACQVPIIVGLGGGLWTNLNFTISDLNLNGLKGNGTDKMLDSGVHVNDAVTAGNNAIGMTVIVTETDFSAPSFISGVVDPDVGAQQYELRLNSGFETIWFSGGSGAGNSITTNDAARVGYVSVGRDTNAPPLSFLDVASPLEAHKRLATEQTGAGGQFDTDCSIPFFCRRIANTNFATSFTGHRISMAGINNFFTETESSNYWWQVKTCRESFGGGSGDPIHDWGNRVVSNGGAAISVTTSNALRTFRQGLDTDGLLYFMVAANAYVPDNLTAARMPVVYQTSNPIWTNTAFGETNLTVNGLTGNLTTKYLGTGIKPNVLNYGGFGDANAGISILIYSATNTGAASLLEYGSAGGANVLFAVQHFGGNLGFFCWTFVTVNTTFVQRAAPPGGSNYSGFISGNRTAANAIALYVTTNQVHTLWTNATGANATVNDTVTNSFAHSIAAANSTPANFSDRTVSFLAIHPGYTQTQSSNLWNRVLDLRTALGGGLPSP